MRVLPALLSSLPLLVTAVPTIIPIAVDQNLSPSTLDLSPDQLDSASPSDAFSLEPFSLDSLPSSSNDDSPPPPPPLIPSTTPTPTGATPCGLPENGHCPNGQMCFRTSYDKSCMEQKTCTAHAGFCRRKIGGLSAGNGRAGTPWGTAHALVQDWHKFSGGNTKTKTAKSVP